jgi:hypothetical protein
MSSANPIEASFERANQKMSGRSNAKPAPTFADRARAWCEDSSHPIMRNLLLRGPAKCRIDSIWQQLLVNLQDTIAQSYV